MHFYPIPYSSYEQPRSSVRHVTSRDVRDQSGVGYVTLQNNTITSLIHSVTSSSPRPALLRDRSSSLFFDFFFAAMFVFFTITFFSKFLGVYTRFLGPRPVTVPVLVSHELLSLRPSFFPTFRPPFFMPSSGRTKGLNYRVQSS